MGARLWPVAGVRVGTGDGGLAKGRRDDVAVFAFDRAVPTAAVFTRNAFAAAPVHVARRNLRGGRSAAWVVNAGNANCGTGRPGLAVAEWSCAECAGRLGAAAGDVLPFSTGVIMEPLAQGKLARGARAALRRLAADNWPAAAAAIMTTDTVAKGSSTRLRAAGGGLVVTGVAKGSGMIHPDMATMLAFLATDAAVDAAWLRRTLRAAVAGSFNAISVDGDTSTNDAVAIAATGAAGPPTAAGKERLAQAIGATCAELAEAIVRDGEGATMLAEVSVTGLASARACRQVADHVANSPLVNTMLHARDANLGRLLMAIGRARVDPAKVAITINGRPAYRAGARVAAFTEAAASRAMKADPVRIAVRAGPGTAAAKVKFCDLGPGYITINSTYRS